MEVKNDTNEFVAGLNAEQKAAYDKLVANGARITSFEVTPPDWIPDERASPGELRYRITNLRLDNWLMRQQALSVNLFLSEVSKIIKKGKSQSPIEILNSLIHHSDLMQDRNDKYSKEYRDQKLNLMEKIVNKKSP